MAGRRKALDARKEEIWRRKTATTGLVAFVLFCFHGVILLDGTAYVPAEK